MNLVCQVIPDGACIVDTIQKISAAQAIAMKADGVDGVLRYGESLTKDEADGILAAGLGLFIALYADHFDGDFAVSHARAVGLVDGTTIVADYESDSDPIPTATAKLNNFATRVNVTDLACLYVGCKIQLGGEGLGGLVFSRYMKSASDVPMPTFQGEARGWSCIQHLGDPRDPKVDWRKVMRGGVNVDIDTAQPDPLGRRLTWTIAVPEAA